MPALALKEGVYPLTRVDGGLNTRSGDVRLAFNETRRMRNWKLDLSGGLKKTPGFTEVTSLPFNCKGLFVYEKADKTFELMAVAYPGLYRINPYSGATQEIYSGLSLTGNPRATQYKNKMHFVDGKNKPGFYDGDTWTAITWIPTLTVLNATQQDSVFALDETMTADAGNTTNGATPGNRPIDAKVWAQRMVYATTDIGILAFSKARGTNHTENFSDNAGNIPPVDIAGTLRIPARSPFTGLELVQDGLIIHCQTEIWKMTGQNMHVPGLPNWLTFTRISDGMGALGPQLMAKKSNDDHVFVSTRGVNTLLQSDNWQTIRPGELSFQIQEDLKDIGTAALSRGRLISLPNQGVIVFVTPRARNYKALNKVWELNYAVGARAATRTTPATTPWSVDEYFGFNASIDAMVEMPPKGDVFFASGNKIYKWEGTSYLNNEPISSLYEFAPINFDAPSYNKKIPYIHYLCSSTTGARFFVNTLWEHGYGGRTEIVVPAKVQPFYGKASFGVDSYIPPEQFYSISDRTIPSGWIVGKNLFVDVEHTSATQDLTIHYLGLKYLVLGDGA